LEASKSLEGVLVNFATPFCRAQKRRLSVGLVVCGGCGVVRRECMYTTTEL
jgi:hypothetical protein